MLRDFNSPFCAGRIVYGHGGVLLLRNGVLCGVCLWIESWSGLETKRRSSLRGLSSYNKKFR